MNEDVKFTKVILEHGVCGQVQNRSREGDVVGCRDVAVCDHSPGLPTAAAFGSSARNAEGVSGTTFPLHVHAHNDVLKAKLLAYLIKEKGMGGLPNAIDISGNSLPMNRGLLEGSPFRRTASEPTARSKIASGLYSSIFQSFSTCLPFAVILCVSVCPPARLSVQMRWCKHLARA
eukprot:702266-Hanusia_phi.AAC.1